MEYLDIDGDLVENNLGVAVYKQSLNRRNIITEKEYLNLKGEYVNGPDGFAHEVNHTTPDARHIIETWRYDSNGLPVSSPDFPAHYVAQTGKRVDMPNTILAEAYYDKEGNLMPGPEGWAK